MAAHSSYWGGKGGEKIQEQQILQKIAEGDQNAFNTLLQQYETYVYRLVYGIVKHEKDAEDIAQEVFVKVYFSLPRFRGDTGFKAWLSRIAVNQAIDYKRKAYRVREKTGGEETWPNMASGENTEDRVIFREERERIRKRIRELPPRYREVVVPFYLQNRSCEEIARELGVARKTVDARLYRARQWMRRHWKEDEG